MAAASPDLPFFPTNFAALSEERSSLDAARVVVLPVPYDSTTSYRGGSRDGPRAIIEASRYLETYDIELGRDIADCGIATLPELEPSAEGPRQTLERVERAVDAYLTNDRVVVTLGGEHSLTVGAVRAYARRYPDLSVLQLDAHGDLRHSYMGSPFSHASVMRRVRETCPAVQIGIRSMSQEEADLIRAENLAVHTYHEGTPWTQARMESALEALSPNVYVTIDLDVFDPSIMSAVGTPEPGGMSWEEVLDVLRWVARHRRIVGFDAMELSPGEGPVACAFTAAKLVYKLIGYSQFPIPSLS